MASDFNRAIDGKAQSADSLAIRIKRLLLAIYLGIVEWAFSYLPLDKGVILLEGSGSFDDNARALFERMIAEGVNDEYRIVWFMDHPERFHYLEEIPGVTVRGFFDSALGNFMSLYSLKLNCTAAICLYSNRHLGMRKLPGQQRVYLMHGVSFKRVVGMVGSTATHTTIISPSEFWIPYIDSCIPGSKGIIEPLGYPRDDALAVKGFHSLLTAPYSSKKKIIWLPTFKHHAGGVRNDFVNETQNDVSLLTEKAMREVNEALERLDAVLFIKFHPYQDLSFVNFVSYSSIVNVTQDDLDDAAVYLYSFLSEFDALITDFSSVAYDYMVLDRPIGFDLTDYGDYSLGLGFLVDDITEFMPGFKIYGINGLVDFIETVVAGEDPYRKERRAFAKKTLAMADGHSSERILDYVGIRQIKGNRVIESGQ